MQAILFADHRAALHLGGLTLLKRAILSLQHAGITSCAVVTACSEFQEKLSSDPQITLPIAFVQTLFEVRGHIKGSTLLLPAHHLYAARIIDDFLSVVQQDATLCIDSSPTGEIQNIIHRNGAIQSIEPKTARGTARDTGLWYCSAKLLSVWIDALEKDREFILQICAKSGHIRAHDINGQFWRIIHTPSDIHLAEKAFLKTLIKPTDGFVSRHFNRKISLWMSRRLVKTPITPNQISMLTMIISFWAAWWVATGAYIQMATGGLLFQFASILDGSDGEVAKLKYLQSSRGELVDTLADDASFIAFFFAIVWGMYRQTRLMDILSLGGIAVALIPLIFFTIHRFLKQAGTRSQVGFITALSSDALNEKRSWFYRASNALKFACRRDFFSAAICLLLLVDKLEWIYWTFIVGSFWFAIVVFGYSSYYFKNKNKNTS